MRIHSYTKIHISKILQQCHLQCIVPFSMPMSFLKEVSNIKMLDVGFFFLFSVMGFYKTHKTLERFHTTILYSLVLQTPKRTHYVGFF